MKNHSNHQTCLDCELSISYEVYNYSTTRFRIALCISCQDRFKSKAEMATPEALDLYIALMGRGVPAELEKWDGFKHIDIAVPEAMVNIEVDGLQHKFDANQALADLKRTFFSFKKGYLTLRIPNCLIINHLEETADYITEFLSESQDQIEEEY